MRAIPDSLAFDLTFGPCRATLVYVEPDLESLGGAGEETQIADYIRRAQAGDPEGYRQLFRLNVQRLFRLVRRLAGPGCDVEDLVQNIFVQAFRALPGFRGESAFFTWLGRIAVRITLRESRAARLRPIPVGEALESAQSSSPEGASDARSAIVRLDGIVSSLSEKRRAAFVLHVLQGHSLEEVAQMLDVRIGAVKVRVHDARAEIERQARRDPYLAHFLHWEETP
jgi:RNA polymerase sigma-70 factor (ECF subfamily)